MSSDPAAPFIGKPFHDVAVDLMAALQVSDYHMVIEGNSRPPDDVNPDRMVVALEKSPPHRVISAYVG